MSLPTFATATETSGTTSQLEYFKALAQTAIAEGNTSNVVDAETLKTYISDIEAKPSTALSDDKLIEEALVVVSYATEVASLPGGDQLVSAYKDASAGRALAKELLFKSGKIDNPFAAKVYQDMIFVTEPLFGTHHLSDIPVTANQKEVLEDVLARVKESKRHGETPVVVFDLDDTLFESPARKKKIIESYITDHPDLDPTIAAQMSAIDPKDYTYSLSDDLRYAGITDATVLKDLGGDYFFSHFFANEYAALDTPYPGAVEYVSKLKKAGATIVYFTGRDEGMRTGTEESFRTCGYPVPDDKTVHMVMKPTPKEDDMAYKTSAAKKIGELGTVVAAFDNEPKGNTIMKTNYPDATVVNLGYSRGPNKGKKLQEIERPLDSVVEITDFRLDSGRSASQK